MFTANIPATKIKNNVIRVRVAALVVLYNCSKFLRYYEAKMANGSICNDCFHIVQRF